MNRFIVDCSHCDAEVYAFEDERGKLVRCPECKEPFRVRISKTNSSNRDHRRRKKESFPWKWMGISIGGVACFLVILIIALSGNKNEEKQTVSLPPTNEFLPKTGLGNSPPSNPTIDSNPKWNSSADALKTAISKGIVQQPPETSPKQIPDKQPQDPPRKKDASSPMELAPQSLGPDKLSAQARFKLPGNTPTSTLIRILSPKNPKDSWVIALDNPVEPLVNSPEVFRGMLARELFRQSISIVAQDELNIVCRDRSLRDSLPKEPDSLSVATLEMSTLIQPGKQANWTIHRIGNNSRELIWSKQIPLPEAPVLDYVRLTEMIEPLIRQELPDLFVNESNGKLKRSPFKKSNTLMDSKLVDQAKRFDPFSQLAVIQAIRKQITIQGESPELLAGLSRTYANLGVLTEYHWCADSKIYKARALLNAQRLFALTPKTATSYWNRAYVETLIGLHSAAEKDLSQAETLNAKDTEPTWLELLKPACRFEVTELETLSRKVPDAELARLLQYLSAENTITPVRGLHIGLEILEKNPECYRVLDSVCSMGGVRLLHSTTQAGPQTLNKTLGKRLSEITTLPPTMKQFVSRIETQSTAIDEQIVLDQLEELSTPDELSWGVLAALIRETRFQQIFRRSDFYERLLRVHPGNEVDRQLDYIKGHPYLSYFARMSSRNKEFGVDRETYSSVVDPSEVQHGDRLAIAFNDTPKYGGDIGWDIARYHLDDTHSDYVMYRSAPPTEHIARNSHHQLSCSPYSPVARARLIGRDWESIEKQAPEWEKQSSDAPAVLRALGARYLALERYPDAERLLKKSIALSGDRPAYQELASIYQKQEKRDQWLKTMESYLKEKDYGLDHATVRIEIARYFMSRKEYAKAKPYAEAAAETGAEWAMRCARDCARLSGDQERAAYWEAQIQRRYGG